MQRIGNGYLFLDWFAIPQLPGRDGEWESSKFFGAKNKPCNKPCIAGALMALRPLKIEVNESYESTVTTISFYLPSWLSPHEKIGIDNSEEATSFRPNL